MDEVLHEQLKQLLVQKATHVLVIMIKWFKELLSLSFIISCSFEVDSIITIFPLFLRNIGKNVIY